MLVFIDLDKYDSDNKFITERRFEIMIAIQK